MAVPLNDPEKYHEAPLLQHNKKKKALLAWRHTQPASLKWISFII